MYDVYERLGVSDNEYTMTVTLDHLQRDKGRIRAVADNGAEVRIFLDRGKALQVGELLKSQCGTIIRIDGAQEAVTTATSDDWQQFSRACYHLGNRHVKIQVGKLWLRITPDHVLEEMLHTLGLKTHHENTCFVPESGAYSHGHNHH